MLYIGRSNPSAKRLAMQHQVYMPRERLSYNTNTYTHIHGQMTALRSAPHP